MKENTGQNLEGLTVGKAFLEEANKANKGNALKLFAFSM